jgi:UDP-N-acetylglucosamine--N-acetylmuramyl-(pentapeptide) pyrophosphoryl-undecaprenol N-acetylglucosamine transferase
MNELAIEYAKNNPMEKVILQAGEKRKDKYIKNILSSKVTNMEIVGFEPMGNLLSRAKVVISRAGSSTINELIENNKPMMVIPFPNSADNHQYENAKYIENTGMGKMGNEKEGIEQLLKKIEDVQKAEQIEKIKENIKKHKKVNIKENVISDIYRILKK